MNKNLQNFFLTSLFGQKYENQGEYIRDIKKRMDVMIDYYLCMVNCSDEEDVSIEAEDFLKNSYYHIVSRVIDSNDLFSFEYLKSVFGFNEFEIFCLMLVFFYEVDSKIHKKIDKILRDRDEIFTYEFVFKIFKCMVDIKDIYNASIEINKSNKKMSTLCFNDNELTLDKRLKQFILSNGKEPIKENGISCYLPYDEKELIANEGIVSSIIKMVEKYDLEEETVFFHLRGKKGIGKKTIVRRTSQVLDMAITMMDVSWLNKENEQEIKKLILTICRENILNQGFICLYNFDCLFEMDTSEQYDEHMKTRCINFILETVGNFSGLVFILSSMDKNDILIGENRFLIDIPISLPTKLESISLWNYYLNDIKIPISKDISGAEMSNKFNFNPGQISGAIREAMHLYIWKGLDEIGMKDLCKCAYTQVMHDLEKQATLIEAKHTLDQLVLVDNEKRMLRDACNQIRYKNIVYDDWGFNKRLTYGKGVSMLFAGPPGTGKTMAAQVVASELGIEIYKVNLSQIVSKYIGETEKNLNSLFEEARKTSVILFFDETDALLGKRTEVKDSHDKNANLQTSYLLQKMEEYDGITILSTNYIENIDQAFFRRISYVIHFSFPDVNSREKIWRSIFPGEVPLSNDVDFEYLANQFEIAGGSIKNIAVVSSFLAAQDQQEVSMKHIIKAIDYELTKQGKIVLKEDFGENGYLM